MDVVVNLLILLSNKMDGNFFVGVALTLGLGIRKEDIFSIPCIR